MKFKQIYAICEERGGGLGNGWKKIGEGFWGDQQPCELVLRGNQDPSLCLLKMMIDIDMIEFKCKWTSKFCMFKDVTWNCACKEKIANALLFFYQSWRLWRVNKPSS
jgi:hypothetical protein